MIIQLLSFSAPHQLSLCLNPTPTLLLIFWFNTNTQKKICYYWYEINDAMGFIGVGKKNWINIVMQIMLICNRKHCAENKYCYIIIRFIISF